MNNEVIYLESDEEITSVIDRLKNSESVGVSLVIPRGSTLAQSIVNLKLLKKSAEGLKKEISLVANDRIASNLASQLGLTVYAKASDAEKAVVHTEKKEVEEIPSNSGFRVNSYNRDKGRAAELDVAEEEDLEEGEDTEEVSKKTPEELKRKIQIEPKEIKEEAPNEADEDYLNQDEELSAREVLKSLEEEQEEEKEEPAFIRKPANLVKPTDKEVKVRKINKKVIIPISLVLIAGLVLAYVFVPSANAVVMLKTENYEQSSTIMVDTSIDSFNLDTSKVPGVLEESIKETTKKFPTTGKKDVGEKATGKIIVSNSWDGSALTLAAGTKFVSGGLNFTSTAAVTTGGAKLINGSIQPGTGTVDVIAEKSGDGYNLVAGKTFSIPSLSKERQAKITGENPNAFTGGTTKQVGVVLQSDIDGAEESMKIELSAQAKTDLEEKSKLDNLVFTEKSVSVEVLSSTTNKVENEEVDEFECTVKIKGTAISFAEKDIVSLVEKQVSKSLGEDKMLVAPEKAEIGYQAEKSESDSAVDLKIQYKGKVATKLNSDNIVSQIVNKNEKNAVALITKNENVESVKIAIWPNFLSRLPVSKNKIKVDFDYQK